MSDWRAETLDTLRGLALQADPGIVETRKWRKPTNPDGVPCFEKDGILFTSETYHDKVKLTFAKGAAIADPKGLFNASLDGNVRRAIDLFEGDGIDAAAFKTLVRGAVEANLAKPARSRT